GDGSSGSRRRLGARNGSSPTVTFTPLVVVSVLGGLRFAATSVEGLLGSNGDIGGLLGRSFQYGPPTDGAPGQRTNATPGSPAATMAWPASRALPPPVSARGS